MTLTPAIIRSDATRRGKPCGASHIPRGRKCSKGTGSLTPKTIETIGKVALGAGALTLGATLLSKRTRKGPAPSSEEWRASPDNPRNNPKLSPEATQRITDEAISGGQKWDAFEATKARRQAENAAFCAGGLTPGKLLAPAKFDAAVRRPRCQVGAGAFGTYFVHTSGKYGVKVFRDHPDDADVSLEFDVLGRAHASGANVPKPLALNATSGADGDVRSQTLIMSHMQGYQTIDSTYAGANPGTASSAPLIVQVKALREFRKLHIDGVAHGDVHTGNVLVHPRSRKVAIVDFGFATTLDSPRHPIHRRDGVTNLRQELERLPYFVGFDDDFVKRHQGVIDNINEQAQNYSRNWEKYELAINRYHDALEREVLWDVRRARSRFVSGAEQPRIPGLTARILSANANTFQREVLERAVIQQPTLFRQGAAKMGLKPVNLWKALAPERNARLAKQRQQPFGTPIAASPGLSDLIRNVSS